jgi:K+-transporting ATPase ATPase C chain
VSTHPPPVVTELPAPTAPRPLGARAPARRPAEPAEPVWRSVRSSGVLLVLIVLIGGYAYPLVTTQVASFLEPATSAGSLLTGRNGTYYGSSLLGENVTDPCLFWLRPSLIDYQAFTGAGSEVPYGPSDPALLNLTAYYAREYGLTNVSLPIDLVAPSASGLDPQILPEAALVQVPRVAQNTTLPQGWLTEFVHDHVQGPVLGFIGPSYVNVLSLDVALLAYLPTTGLGAGC